MVKALHRAGIEVILDVVYNHTAEGNHLGPMLAFKGVDNASYYRLDARRPAPLHGLHGHGQLAQPRPPDGAAADHGLAALLRPRVPRRRLPLRPRLGARARVLRRRPALGVLRHHPPGPGPLAGEADRRAVGRRAGRLPGRQLPGAVGGVEREVPRRDARLLARAGERRRVRAALHRLERPLRGRRPRPVRVDQLRHRARRLHARATSSPTTTSTTRRTARTTSDGTDDNRSWNYGVEGETDDPEIRALRARQQRNFLATLLPLAGRADAPRRRRARPHAGRQQQRLVPGQRDLVARLGPTADERAARVHAAADRAAAGASGLPAQLVPRAARPASRGYPTSGGSGPTGGG